MSGIIDSGIDLNSIQEPFFRQNVHRCAIECISHYHHRLVAVYVRGSVHRNEALPGISDLDMCVFTIDGFTANDRQ